MNIGAKSIIFTCGLQSSYLKTTSLGGGGELAPGKRVDGCEQCRGVTSKERLCFPGNPRGTAVLLFVVFSPNCVSFRSEAYLIETYFLYRRYYSICGVANLKARLSHPSNTFSSTFS